MEDHDPVERPFFIVGAERSGTTLLRLMIDHHPAIGCHYEFEFSVDWVTDDGRMPSMEEVRRRFERPWLRDALTAPGCDGSFPDVETHEQFVNWKLRAWRDAGGKRDIGATVHRNFERLIHIWPDARFIHIVRDGRDVARSRVQMLWHGNVWTAIDAWLEAEAAWDRLSQVVPKARRMEVSYEQLIAAPSETLSEICEFLGHPFSERMLDYVSATSYDLPDPANAQRWQQQADGAEISLVEAKAGAMLEARGYALSGLERVVISDRESARLKVECARKRRKMRIKRYGLPMLVARRIAAMSPFSGLQKWIDERMHRVARRYIK